MSLQLEALPDHRDRLIVVGASCRKSLDILQAFLTSLAWQELPRRTRLHFCFVDDFTPQQAEAKEALKVFLLERGGELLRGVPSAVGDFSDDHPQSHQWSLEAMRRVGSNKNRILSRARELKADAVWLVDTDLILDRTVLTSLIACDKHVACAVYWTRWSRQTTETQKLWAAPTVWLRHPYQLDGRGMDEATFRGKLVNRHLTRVWGQGACTLLSKHLLQSGVDFSPAPEFPQQGLNAGEDRQFCVQAERRHIEMWADAWPDIFHIYHRTDDVPRIPQMLERLGTPHPESPKIGDWVNVVLTALEPVPDDSRGYRQWLQVAPQHVRGRLGAISLLPELEDAISGLTRGSEIIAPVHCPVHYPHPYLRGRRRLVRVQLVDCKSNAAPPILDEDLHMTKLGTAVDVTTLTTEQLAALRSHPDLALVR